MAVKGFLIDFLLKEGVPLLTDQLKKLGPKHNTHVCNATSKPVKAVIRHVKSGGVETRVLEPRGKVCFPTPHGRVEVYVIPYKNNNFGSVAEARVVDDSDRSFIVKQASTGDLNLVRSVYGKLWTEA